MSVTRGGSAAPLKPCFGDWHPGKRMCWKCDDEKECYAKFELVYGAGRCKPNEVRP